MDGFQIPTNIIFFITLIINLNDLKNGSVLTPYLMWATVISGLMAIPDLYFNRLQGLILPLRLLDPDYEINRIKSFLDPKISSGHQSQTYCNGRILKPSHFTSLDYLSRKLGLNSNQRITRHLALFPIKGSEGFIFLRFYYAFSTESYGPGLHDGLSFITRYRTTKLNNLENYLSEFEPPTQARKL
jgi:hypothetical protein